MSIEEAYDQYVDKVYSFFYVKSLHKNVAEDLTSQTFMVVVEKVSDPDYVITDMKKFVYGVMRNVWLMFLREKYNHVEQAWEDVAEFENYVDEELTEYSQMTVKQRAETYINRLPDRQREILTMRLLEGLSVKDICNAFGKDRNYVKTTYRRGVITLRKVIETQNVTPHTAERGEMI